MSTKRGACLAATALALTQPTASSHIKELEQSLHMPLFNRLGREIQPTDMADLTIAAEFGSFGAIKEAIRNGHGASFLSDITVDSAQRPRIMSVKVPELGTIRLNYYVATSRRHVPSPVTRAFLDHLHRNRPAQTKAGPARRSNR